MNLTTSTCAAGLAAILFSQPAAARPIVYAHSLTLMADYSDDSMQEIQAFYAPRFNWSYGVGNLVLEGHGASTQHEVSYARLNLLAKRWNLEAAQANIFGWGGVGSAHSTEWVPEVPGDSGGHGHGADPVTVPGYERTSSATAWNVGGQIDYETRRIYTSLRTDFYNSSIFWHRIDTVQFGVAPYQHDMNTLATWLVISGKRHSGDSHEAEEVALLLRFFKKRFWIEAGATTDGKLRAHAMFNL